MRPWVDAVGVSAGASSQPELAIDRRSAGSLAAGGLVAGTAMLLLITAPVVLACAGLAGFDDGDGDLGFALVAGIVAGVNGAFLSIGTVNLWWAISIRRTPRGLWLLWPIGLAAVAVALVVVS